MGEESETAKEKPLADSKDPSHLSATSDNEVRPVDSNTSSDSSVASKLIVVGCIIAALLSYLFTPWVHLKIHNYYIKSRYLPMEALTFYVERPLDDVTIRIPIYFKSVDFPFPDLIDSLKVQLREKLHKNEQLAMNLEFDMRYVESETDITSDDFFNDNALLISLILNDKNGIYVDGSEGFAELYYSLEAVVTNDLPFFVTQLILDHCYRKELEFYSIDNFVKLIEAGTGKQSVLHYDSLTKNEMNGFEKQKIHLRYCMLGGEINWDIKEAIEEYARSILDALSDYYDFTIEEENSTYFENNELQYIDEYFPIELSDLPSLPNFYKEVQLRKAENDEKSIYLTFYPFSAGGDAIKNKSVDDTEIYSDYENTYLQIKNWGSIYFGHWKRSSEPEDELVSLKANNLKDCIWSFNECILDTLGVPNENMAPKLRVEMFRRIKIVKNLTMFSYKLSMVVRWLDENDYYITNHIVDAILECFSMREEILNLLKTHDLGKGLKQSMKLVENVESLIKHMNIQNRDPRLANISEDQFE
ncbi:hypothetical protein CANARDRAFT_26073 [[Candida] arabinofermentans NRRL YB-2248]|uniref:Uncharacterized protein n=1 Tax=[Candida] arabinofermentans NRRL YB-2248 TaxID=983967 RepID=A0A1E4T812_9ASCO|nr:hypothetical protein CANARDRAFT_26073 [[Candida] arabinofermentans NRRL YB-2248]